MRQMEARLLQAKLLRRWDEFQASLQCDPPLHDPLYRMHCNPALSPTSKLKWDADMYAAIRSFYEERGYDGSVGSMLHIAVRRGGFTEHSGDGTDNLCFFDSLRQAAALPGTARQLRTQALRWIREEADAERDRLGIRSMAALEAWASTHRGDDVVVWQAVMSSALTEYTEPPPHEAFLAVYEELRLKRETLLMHGALNSYIARIEGGEMPEAYVLAHVLQRRLGLRIQIYCSAGLPVVYPGDGKPVNLLHRGNHFWALKRA